MWALPVKKPEQWQRLSAIGAMADEPVQSWLDNEMTCSTWLCYCMEGYQQVLHKNERTIRRWVDDFVSNGGEFSESHQGHYVRNNTLMSNEELCEGAREYVQENAAPQGRPNLTAGAFCQWVNNEISPRPRLP